GYRNVLFFGKDDKYEGGFLFNGLIYKLFNTNFGVGELYRTIGLVGARIIFGKYGHSIEELSGFNRDLLFVENDRERITEYLEVLDKEMQWRMTEEQKRDVGIIEAEENKVFENPMEIIETEELEYKLLENNKENMYLVDID